MGGGGEVVGGRWVSFDLGSLRDQYDYSMLDKEVSYLMRYNE